MSLHLSSQTPAHNHAPRAYCKLNSVENCAADAAIYFGADLDVVPLHHLLRHERRIVYVDAFADDESYPYGRDTWMDEHKADPRLSYGNSSRSGGIRKGRRVGANLLDCDKVDCSWDQRLSDEATEILAHMLMGRMRATLQNVHRLDRLRFAFTALGPPSGSPRTRCRARDAWI